MGINQNRAELAIIHITSHNIPRTSRPLRTHMAKGAISLTPSVILSQRCPHGCHSRDTWDSVTSLVQEHLGLAPLLQI